MTQFEFFMVIAGVVIAIAMAEVVSGWGRLVRTNATVQLDWLQFGWTVIILLNSMIYWVGIWPYSGTEFETLGQIYFLVIPTLFLVLIAFAITPTEFDQTPFSMRRYYLSRRKPIFLFYGLFIATSSAADFIVAGGRQVELWSLIPLFSILAAYVYLAVTERIWVHATIMFVALLSMVLVGFTSLNTIFERFQ